MPALPSLPEPHDVTWDALTDAFVAATCPACSMSADELLIEM